jgi:hypothetical protein
MRHAREGLASSVPTGLNEPKKESEKYAKRMLKVLDMRADTMVQLCITRDRERADTHDERKSDAIQVEQ